MEKLAGYALEVNIGGGDELEANIGGVSMLRGADGKDGAPGIYYGTTQPTGDTHPVWIDPNGDHDDGGLLPAVTAADNGKVLRVVNSAWSAEVMQTGGTDMGITGATVGQIAKITAVDGTGKPTAWSPADMPDKLPNPNALTFTGAVTGSYDGSAPLTVNIPNSEGGSGGGGDVFELIGEATSSGVSDTVGLTIPFNGSLYKTIVAYAYNLPAGNKKRIIIRRDKVWYDGSPLGWNTVVDSFMPSMTNMSNTWGFFGAAIDVGGKLFTLGAAEANANGGHGYFRFYPQTGALPTVSMSDRKFISLDCNSASEILPDGCSLIVWGVRK